MSRCHAAIGSVVVGFAATAALAGQPPLADAGPDRYIGSNSIILDGTRSNDPDPGDVLAYAWTQLSGPSVTIVGPTVARPTVVATPTSQMGRAVLQLTVTDSTSLSSSDTMNLTIVPAVPGNITMVVENAFNPNKPTFVYFGGGDGISGGGRWGSLDTWGQMANIISFDYGPPYESCGDALIAYLSRMAPEYDRPIQTAGWSTGGQPALDAAAWVNTQYHDAHFAINRVVLLWTASLPGSSTFLQPPAPFRGA